MTEDWRCHTILGTSGWGKTRYAKHFITEQLNFMSAHTPQKSGAVILDIERDYLKMFTDTTDLLYPYRKLFKFIELDKSNTAIDFFKHISANRFMIFAPDRSDKAINTGKVLNQDEWVEATSSIIEKVLLVKNRLLVIEEAHNYGTNQKLPWSIEEAIKQGRHRDECEQCYSIRVMAITQRANKLNPEYRAQSTFFTSFRQDEELDLNFIQGRFKEHTDKIPKLAKGESLQYRKNEGTIVKLDSNYKIIETWGLQ